MTNEQFLEMFDSYKVFTDSQLKYLADAAFNTTHHKGLPIYIIKVYASDGIRYFAVKTDECTRKLLQPEEVCYDRNDGIFYPKNAMDEATFLSKFYAEDFTQGELHKLRLDSHAIVRHETKDQCIVEVGDSEYAIDDIGHNTYSQPYRVRKDGSTWIPDDTPDYYVFSSDGLLVYDMLHADLLKTSEKVKEHSESARHETVKELQAYHFAMLEVEQEKARSLYKQMMSLCVKMAATRFKNIKADGVYLKSEDE